MALSTEITHQVTIEEDGLIYLRRTKRVLEDGEVIGERFHRTTLEPGDDVSALPFRIQRITEAVWTPAVITAYQAAKAARVARDILPATTLPGNAPSRS